jgi:hypothetical protein
MRDSGGFFFVNYLIYDQGGVNSSKRGVNSSRIFAAALCVNDDFV